MGRQRIDIVTGAFGYTGRYIARRLLESGDKVRTLTSRSAADSPFGEHVRALCSLGAP